MRTLRLPVAMLAALAATAVAAGASAQPTDPPSDPPAEAPAAGTEAPPAEAPPADAPPADAPPAEGTEGTEPPPPPKPTNETACSDGVDEDGDGATDCADTDCAQQPACAPPAPEPPPAAAPPAPPVAPPTPADPEADKETEDKPPLQTTLGLEGLVGVTGRVGSVSSGYDASERAGLQYGLGVLYAPDRQFAFGLSYIYSGLGAEEFDPSVSDASGKIRRRLHNVAAQLRAYPLRSDKVGLWAGLNVGLTWQSASASGAVATGSVASPAETYQADAGPQAGLALGAAFGMDLVLSRDLAMLTSLNFTNHRLTSDALDGDAGDPPVPGIGSVSQVDFRLAFQYRFDVSGGSAPVSASFETGSR